MAPRIPTSETCDAVVELDPPGRIPHRVYALVKQTYAILGDRCRLAAPEPLQHDLRDPDLSPRLPTGTDFWPEKDATDFVVRGAAFAPGGSPVERMTVSAQLGRAGKRIQITGKRGLAFGGDGKPRILPPERFTSIPLVYENAYGGIDARVPVKADSLADLLVLRSDHPGLYPRNPFGKGYLVERGPVEGAEMPNLEDPEDPLTEDRLLVRDPRRWYEQPLPWTFDWAHPMTFPRYVFAPGNPDAWFPAPEDERLPEVKRGYLVRGYRTALAEHAKTSVVHPRFYQEASPGFALSDVRPGAPLSLEGMHPEERRLSFALPDRFPRIEIIQEGRAAEVAPRLHTVLCRPAEKIVCLVFGAAAPLHRPFLPGIHKHIPLAVSVDGGRPIPYLAPVPAKERLQTAMDQRGANRHDR